MAILKIARMGHPVLRQPAAAVDNPRDPALARLVADMIETMQDAPGVGLAAPQVGAGLQVVIFGFESSMVTTTIVGGRVLMRDRQLLTLDEAAITARSRELATKVWRRYEELSI